jgi:non-ribosomal peptide synthetase component F
VTNLPVRVRVSPEEPLLSWLASLQQRQGELWQHQYTPLEQIQSWAQVPWRFRLFDSLVVFQNYQIDETARRIGTDARLVPVTVSDTTSYALTLMVIPETELRLRLTYQSDQLATHVVQTYATDLAMMLRAMTEQRSQKLAELLARLPAASRGRAAAAAARTTERPAGKAAVAPRTPTEHMVLGVFRDLLQQPQVGVLENFFDLGGHSIAAVRLMSKLRAASGLDLPLRNLFERPTAAGLAEAIDALAWSKPSMRRSDSREQLEL